MSRNLLCWTIAVVCGSVQLAGAAGCGASSMSASQMRQYAMRRSSDDDEQKEPLAKPQTKPTGPKPAQPKPTQPKPTQPTPARPTPTQATPTQAKPTQAKPTQSEPSPTDPTTSSALNDAERQDLARRRIRTLGVALRKYVLSRESFPASEYRGNVSWRVRILPYLGYRELYDKFRLEEPWDSPHNEPLLAEIPDVYRSPERNDSSTCFLASLLLAGGEGVEIDRISDGMDNTVAVVEVRANLAVPWTKPGDLTAIGKDVAAALQLRGDTYHVLAAAGRVVEVPQQTSAADWAAMFTPAGGEKFTFAQLKTTALSVPAEPADADDSPPTVVGAGPRPTADSPATTPLTNDGGAGRPVGRNLTTTPTVVVARSEVPAAPRQQKARRQFRELYLKDYRELTSSQQRSQFAARLLETSDELVNEPASHFVLLEITQQIAVAAGNASVALDALNRQTLTYEVDSHELRARLFGQLVRLKDAHRHRDLLDQAEAFIDEAETAQAYTHAENLCRAAFALARRASPQKAREMDRRLKRTVEAKQAFRAADNAITALDKQPNDPVASLALGRYLCFYRDDWENGLPLLAQGGSAALKRLAELELAKNRTPENTVALADRWFDRGGRSDPVEKEAMRQRALHWYQQALPALPAGFLRIKVQKRVDELSKA